MVELTSVEFEPGVPRGSIAGSLRPGGEPNEKLSPLRIGDPWSFRDSPKQTVAD